ncbi:MAG: pyridoxamine 5'-phosphate oxidase family protein [Candidatus Omnitrophica bacterium]|nr:pyridoxamine 5'-phosphate oxidase family protein [Candidatus Omnitrophota bacterium]MDD5236340.1 pyridoxamine 5'-phosphate oxidase family protein [Candidatus Omnitrophota bacterium]MDD5610222.1 pyridoxamine 5'-phosphate oxidase family protein [Candidatus Omnitrophota bacterium]
MLSKKISRTLGQKEFIHIATSNPECRPNAAPKFLLRFENNFIYLVDYTISRTWKNLKINPRASLSVMDTDTLLGYQINGKVEIIERGAAYRILLKEFKAKGISLSAQRIVEGLRREKTHKSFEAALPEKVVFFKLKIEEVVEIGTHGGIKREKL